jgi:iron(III) transport system permease protein
MIPKLVEELIMKRIGVIAIILMLFSIAILTVNNYITGSRKSFTTVTGKSGQAKL